MGLKASKEDHGEYVSLLKLIFDFLRATGMNASSIRILVECALNEAVESRQQKVSSKDTDLATAARVLDAWHRNARYIDESAVPRAIPLLGRAPSVEALIRKENTHCDATIFAKRMRTLGLLTRSGRTYYKPADCVAVVAGLGPSVKQYVASSSATLLQTISNNVSTPVRSAKLIERFAEVPDLPEQCAAEFRKFSHEQGWAMLKTLNDWLESRRARRNTVFRGRTVRAGVHLYAYLDPTNK